MRRREFIGLISVATLGFAPTGRAQTKSDLPIIGLLLPQQQNDAAAKARIAAVRDGLRAEGLVEGTNYSLAARYSEGSPDRAAQILREFGVATPRVFVVAGVGIDLTRQSFPNVPIVFTGVAADPLERGWIQSYAHPGGMLTGNVLNAIGGEETIVQKRIGLFKQLVPNLNRIGIMASDAAVAVMKEMDALRKVANELGFELVHYSVNKGDDLEGKFAAAERDGVSAFYISGEPLLVGNMSRVISLVSASRKPSVGTYPDWGRAGLLMSYAADPIDVVRRAGVSAAKILKGAYPGSLPIEQATKFTLVINQNTAKMLSIVVPSTLLALADEVVE